MALNIHFTRLPSRIAFKKPLNLSNHLIRASNQPQMPPIIPTLAISDDFETQELLKQAGREYVLYHTFEYITIKVNKTRYTIRCKSEGCP